MRKYLVSLPAEKSEKCVILFLVITIRLLLYFQLGEEFDEVALIGVDAEILDEFNHLNVSLVDFN